MAVAMILSWPALSIASRTRWEHYWLSPLIRDLSGKRVELLKENLPKMSAWLSSGTQSPGPAIAFKEIESAARTSGCIFNPWKYEDPNRYRRAFQAAKTKERADALITRD